MKCIIPLNFPTAENVLFQGLLRCASNDHVWHSREYETILSVKSAQDKNFSQMYHLDAVKIS